jgi:hypothetical protein
MDAEKMKRTTGPSSAMETRQHLEANVDEPIVERQRCKNATETVTVQFVKEDSLRAAPTEVAFRGWHGGTSRQVIKSRLATGLQKGQVKRLNVARSKTRRRARQAAHGELHCGGSPADFVR